MSKDEAIKNATDKTNDVIEFKNDAINCSEIPNGSIIRRQDVIELVKKSYYDLSDGEEDMWAMVHDVEQLPSAEPNLMEDGTLEVNVPDARLVKRVLVGDEKNWGGLYYPDEEPKTGKWVKASDHGVWSFSDEYAECDQCHKVAFNGWGMNYCPNCASYNGGDEE